jgi:phosphonate transport system ATP-binding protein
MLSTHDLQVIYPGSISALKPTTLAFGEGVFTVLLGPSGAGKSTLLRCLNGLVRPTNGRVLSTAHGDIRSGRVPLRRHRAVTGMVFQQHHLIGRLTALANVLVGRLGHHSALRSLMPLPREDQRIALEALERVDLLDRALTRVDQLSGGQQQRVGIARAVAQQPRLILADEPVASLDPATAARVLDLLRTICKADGITAIVSLHQVDLARSFADRVIGLQAGAVVFDGAPGRLGEADLQRIYGSVPSPAKTLEDERVRPRRQPTYAAQPA